MNHSVNDIAQSNFSTGQLSLQISQLQAKGLKMVQLNARSLLRNIDELRTILCTNSIDIGAFNETWLDDTVMDNEIGIDHYKIVRKDRNRRGGGVILYVREEYEVEVLQHASLQNLEALAIRVRNKSSQPFIFITWYRPPSGHSELFDHYESLLSFVDSFNNSIVIMGDLNCDILKKPLQSNTKRVILIHENFALQPLNVTESTRVSETSSSLIDLMLTNRIELIKSSGVIDIGLSDHSMNFIVWGNSPTHATPRVFHYRKFQDVDVDAFCERLQNQPWENVILAKDISQAVKLWEDYLLEIVNLFMPIKSRKVKNKSSPWMTSEIVKLIKQRNKIKKKSRRTKNSEDIIMYRKLRNKVTCEVRKAKKNYYVAKLSRAKGKSTDVWKILKSVIPKSQVRDPNTNSEDSKIKTNEFNQYFSSIGAELASKIKENPNLLQFENNVYTAGKIKFKFHSVSEDAVYKELMRLKDSASVGLDEISSKMLKISAPVIVPYLTYIINRSLFENKFPNQWKMSKIIPIHKSGNTTSPNNFRPISIQPTVSKLLERFVQRQFMAFLEENSLLSPAQFGFRRKHSTVTSLVKVTDEWMKAIDEGKYTGAVFIDLKKAFDCVNHDLLLCKLRNIGVSEECLPWFADYLKGRFICTSLNSNLSTPLPISFGVPQGSILGPLLFIVFINDLFRYAGNCSIQLYADDTVVYFSGNDVDNIQTELNNSLFIIHKWMCSNKLTINFDKTVSFLIGSRHMLNKHDKLEILINDIPIQQVDHVKYLGFVIDNRLKWDIHAENLCSKAGKLINYLARLRYFINESNLNLIYKAIILPLFDYADIILGSSDKKHLKRLQSLQNRAGKIIMKINPYEHVSNSQVHSVLDWLSLESRRKKHLSIFVFKSVHNMLSASVCDMFQPSSFTYSLRNSGNIMLPKPRTEYCRRTTHYRGSLQYNSLPQTMKISQSQNIFMKDLETFIPAFL